MAVMITMAVPVPTMNAATVNSQATTATVDQRVGRRPVAMARRALSQRDPGIPSSRLKAKSIRPAAASDDRPQNHIAIAMPADRRSPSCAEVVDEDRDDGDAAAEVVLAGAGQGRSGSGFGNSVERFGRWVVRATRKM